MPGLPPPVILPPAIHAPALPQPPASAEMKRPAAGQPLPKPNPPDAAQPPDPVLMRSARKFEAMAIAQLLQPMFNTVRQPQAPFGGGAGEEAWRSLMVEELAKRLADQGGLGLAKPIYEAMQRMQGARRK